jgi:hypothetical protein
MRRIQEGQVRYRGLNTAGGWIRNPGEIAGKFVARGASVVVGAMRSAEYQGGFDPRRYIRETAKLARDTQTGNCSELSSIAFERLESTGIRPIDYFAVYRGSWNHAFVILNRPGDVPVADFARWSYYAVVCDPLYDRAATAGMLCTWYPRMFPLRDKDVAFRLE